MRVQLGCPFEDVTSSFNGNGTDVLMEGGTLAGTAAWRLSPAYSMLLNGHLTVGSTGQLTVGAGTRIKPSQHAGIYVDGRLVVAGTAGQPVVFTDRRDDSVGGDANRDGDETQPDRNWWRGIQVREEGQAQLTHTTVRYTGYWDSVGIRKLGSGNLTLDEVTVEHGAGDGVRLENSTGETVLTGCVLRHNGQNGLRLQSGTVTATGCRFEENDGHGVRQTANDHLVYAANEFAGNALGSVGIESGTLTVDRQWTLGQEAGFVVRVLGHFTVGEGLTLRVDPGMRVTVAQNAGFYVPGRLEAVGTAAQPILFEGSTAQPGWWRGLQVTGTGSAHLEHAEVAHGGYWDSVNLVKTGTGALILRQVTIRDGTQDGLRIGPGSASFVTENNRFERNETAVRIQLGCPFEDVTSVFQNNETDALMEGGTLAGTAAWRLSPAYSMLLNGHLIVGPTGQLTVGAGSRIKPSQHAGIYVNGRLVVEGTAGQPVVFTDRRDDSVGGDANRDGDETQPDRNWWRGIQVQEEGQAQLTHTTVRYTGYWDSVGIRKLGSGNLTLDEVTVEHGAGDGVRLENSTGETVLIGCVLRHNGQNGLRLQSGTVTATGCRFEQNDGHGVRQTANDKLAYAANEFGGNALGSVGIEAGSLTVDRQWTLGQEAGFVVRVLGHLTVGTGTTLRVDPGVRVTVAQHAGFYVPGRLEAMGTSAQPVLFEGSTAQPGWWRGLQVTGDGSAHLEHAEVAHGGYWDSVNLRKTGAGSLTLQQVTVRNGSADGLRIENSSGTHQIADNRFVGNQRGVRLQGANPALSLAGSHFEGNSLFGVENQTNVEVDARNSWWNAPSGPLHPTLNPTGSGDPVSDLVLFDPWRTEPQISEVAQLTVILEPAEAREAGARWDLQDAIWRTSGTTLSIDPGTYTIEFQPLAGWVSPPSQTVHLEAEDHRTVNATFTPAALGTETTFTEGPPLAVPRMAHHVATLPDGRVALFGGHGTGFVSLNTAEIRAADAASPTLLTMQQPRDTPAFAQLADGRFLLAGGSRDLGVPSYAAAEVFDPTDNSFTAVGNLVRFRAGAGAVALANGRVVVAGAWWTHNDAHTYGEVFETGTGLFQAIASPNQARAYPVLLPVNDGSARLLGGLGPSGTPIVAKVEQFDLITSTWSLAQETLFPGDPNPDWRLIPEARPVQAHQLADGRYVFLAHRVHQGTTTYRLLLFNPVTAGLSTLAVTPDLPNSDSHFLWQPIVDRSLGRLYLLAQRAGSSPPELSLFQVDVATGQLHELSGRHLLSPSYSLSGAALTRLADGRLFLSGGSADGSNFDPVAHTLILTPGEPGDTPTVVLDYEMPELGILELSWMGSAGDWQLETSVDLIHWEPMTAEPVHENGRWRLTVPMTDPVRFYQLQRSP